MKRSQFQDVITAGRFMALQTDIIQPGTDARACFGAERVQLHMMNHVLADSRMIRLSWGLAR